MKYLLPYLTPKYAKMFVSARTVEDPVLKKAITRMRIREEKNDKYKIRQRNII